jgi:hypothetical protein
MVRITGYVLDFVVSSTAEIFRQLTVLTLPEPGERRRVAAEDASFLKIIRVF